MVAIVGCATALTAALVVYFVTRLQWLKFSVMQQFIEAEHRYMHKGDFNSSHFSDAPSQWLLLPEAGLPFGCAYAALLVVNVTYVLLAATIVAWKEPLVAGSGMPEIKALLNGVKLPGVVQWRTLGYKVVGQLFSVAAGLPVGKECAMLHCGAILGAGLSQGCTTPQGGRPHAGAGSRLPLTAAPKVTLTTCHSWCFTGCCKVASFRNDKDKRDFVSW